MPRGKRRRMVITPRLKVGDPVVQGTGKRKRYYVVGKGVKMIKGTAAIKKYYREKDNFDLNISPIAKRKKPRRIKPQKVSVTKQKKKKRVTTSS